MPSNIVTTCVDSKQGLPNNMSLAGLNTETGMTIEGLHAGDVLGRSVQAAGDINGDGIDDVMISAYGADINGESSGVVYVLFGTEDELLSNFDLTTLDGSNGFTIIGPAASSELGKALDALGDVNGDGIDDLVVGAPGASPNGKFSGAAYVVFGSSMPFSPTLEVSTLDGSDGFSIHGQLRNDFAGTSVSKAGDVNGDGFQDLLIGAPFAQSNEERTGACYIVFGKNSFSPSLELSSLDGSNGISIQGVEKGDHLGGSITGGMDINGDFKEDFAIGAPGVDYEQLVDAGASYIILGNSFDDATFDLNSLDGSNGFVIRGNQSYDRFGSEVSSLKDMNGDGKDDLAIGAEDATINGEKSGAVYVLFGNTTFTPNFSASTLSGNKGFTINGTVDNGHFGASIGDVGDINQDGFTDLIVGADGSRTNAGLSYLLYGKSNELTSNFNFSFFDGINGITLGGGPSEEVIGYAVSPCLLYTSPSPRDATLSRMPSSA